jgi:hypothetical protein
MFSNGPVYLVSFEVEAQEMCAKEMVLICRVSVMQHQFYVTRFTFVGVPAAF